MGSLHQGVDDAGQAVPYDWFEQAVSWIESAGLEAVLAWHEQRTASTR
jgi:hypothetical protein